MINIKEISGKALSYESKEVPLSTLKLSRELPIFSSFYDIDNLTVRQVYDKIREWSGELERNPKIVLTSLQHDLIIGTLFGDANVRQRNVNCSYRVGHSKKQKKYLLFKYEIMKELSKSKPVWSTRNFKDVHKITTLEFSTTTHYIFNYYRKLFYSNGRKVVSRKSLNLLTPRSLAFWICDDGSYDKKQSYIVLCTNSFSLKEHKIMKKYFNDVWGLDPTIGFRDNKYYYLRFKQRDSKKLIRIIKPFVPSSMEYKVGGKNV